MQHLTELGLHCGSVYLHGTIILRMTGVDEEEVAPIVERLEDAYSMAMTTLSLEDAIEEIKLRSHDIRDWYFAHEDAGTTIKALYLLNEEDKQCFLIMSWLSDRLEHAKK